MDMRIVMTPQPRQRSLLIIDVTGDMPDSPAIRTVPSLQRCSAAPLRCTSHNSPVGATGARAASLSLAPTITPCSASPSCGTTSTWSPGAGRHTAPHPAPVQADSTGSQPVSTPSGCSDTRAA